MKILPTYNGVLLYDHKEIDVTLELDTSQGFWGYYGSCVYHLMITMGFRNSFGDGQHTPGH